VGFITHVPLKCKQNKCSTRTFMGLIGLYPAMGTRILVCLAKEAHMLVTTLHKEAVERRALGHDPHCTRAAGGSHT